MSPAVLCTHKVMDMQSVQFESQRILTCLSSCTGQLHSHGITSLQHTYLWVDALTLTFLLLKKYLKEFERVEEKFKRQQKHDFDRHHRVQSLPDIQEYSSLWITPGNHPTPGVVQSSLADAPRYYLVQTDMGTVRRNRQHLSPNSGANSTPDSSPARSPIMTRSGTGTAINPPDSYVGLASKERCGENNHTTV